MPPKKANNRKASTKLAASSADAEVLNNGEKELVEEVATDANILPNGDSIPDENEAKASPKLKANKRSGGRAKNVAPDLDDEAPVGKKPVAKGRGKKKSNENEVIENENGSQPDTQEIDDTEINKEIETKPKARGGGKKAVSKKVTKANKISKEQSSVGDVEEENINQVEEAKTSEKATKASGRKKKQEEQVEQQQQDIIEDVVEEKDSKRNRNSKKSEETATVIEPQKKKGRAAKKEKIVEKDDAELVVGDDKTKIDAKEKKSTKRGRAAAAKEVPAIEETAAINGDAEEVLPKKRSRKAPSVEKEIVKEKPKRGRAKKSDKEEIEADVELKGKETEHATNGEDKLEKIEEKEDIEEITSSVKKAESEIEPAAATVAKATAKGGRKRAAPSANNKKTAKTTTADEGREELLDDVVDNAEVEDEADGSKTSKTKKSKTDTALVNSTVTKYKKEDFDLPPPSDGQTAEEPRFNLKISSWNVAGLRSWVKKDGLKFLDYEQPDIFCMQETKCTNDQLPEEVVPIPGYHPYWLCMPGGYAGVAIYSKIMPINVEYGIGHKDFDDSGRVITAEYEKFFLVNVYVPNSGRKLVNLDARMKWEKLFQQFIQDLDARKPVVICGDMNVSHQEIDLANPKSNTRSAGFTKEEREKMTELLGLGFIDTFRHLYPERKGAYTYWTYMANARSRNVGWRLDYFIVAERFIKRIVDNCIRSQCMGSDHCPITLFLNL